MDPTGAVKYTELLAHTGDFLGYGWGELRGDPAWDRRQEYRVKDGTKGGVLQVYKPPILPGDREAHGWSFLRPVQQVTVASGGEAAPLPPDFGGIEGGGYVRLTGSTRQSQRFVPRADLGTIYEMRAAQPSRTGPPVYFAEEPLQGTTDGQGQRWRLAVFPTADQAYTLWVQYYLNRDVQDGMGNFIYGGADHWNLFVISVKAWCEANFDGQAGGPLNQRFMQELAASVSRDRKRKAETLGYNGDGRGRVWTGRGIPENQYETTTVTYLNQVW